MNKPTISDSTASPEKPPCPFCGSRRIVINRMLMDADWFGHCLDCDAKGPTDMDKAEAARLWGRRIYWERDEYPPVTVLH